MTSFTSRFTPIVLPLLGLVRFPEITISPEDRAELGVALAATNRDVLRKATWKGYQGLRAKGAFDGIDEAAVIARFKTEFEVFDKTGVIDYLLLVWDVNRWCDQQGIVRGYGRGSAGGSLTLFALGVVRVNALKHSFDFRRFLSEARMKPVIKDGVLYVDGKSAPDIDCDYEYLKRPQVVAYIERRFPGRTCKISTRLDLTGKMALKNVAKVYGGLPDEEAKAVSDLIEVKYGKVQGLHEARHGSESGGKVVPPNDAVVKWIAASEANAELYDLAMAIEGLAVARGQHPSGVAISYDLIEGNVPVEHSKDGDVVTSNDMETVAGILIKLDILGLRTLDLVAGTAALAGVSVDSLDVNDSLIYSSLPTHDRYLGLFQIADGLTKQAAHKIGPRNVDELASVLAISRPGALSYIGQFTDYVKTGVIKPFYPPIDQILKSTGGALIMQEQITDVCRDVLGMSGVDADQVRYAVGKKKREEMVKWQSVVMASGRARGVPEAVLNTFWATCNASADYLFVKIHATEYGYLTAATILLKARYPLQFYVTMLKLAREEPNPTAYMNQIISEMASVGLKVLPPDVVRSEADFTIQDGQIRFGLQSIKGISEATMAKVIAFKGQSFETRFQLFEAIQGAKVPINTLVSLVYSGCIDTKGTSRSYYALNAQLYNLLTEREKPIVHKLAKEHSEDLIAILKALPSKVDDKGRPLIREARLETLRRDYRPYWAMYQQNSQNEELTAFMFERSLLGFSYTTTLHAVYSKRVVGLTSITDVLAAGEKARLALEEAARLVATLPGQPGSAPDSSSPPVGGAAVTSPSPRAKRERGQVFKVVAFIEEAKVHLSRKDGTPYLKVTLVDDSASLKAMLYGTERVDASKSFNGRLAAEEDCVIATGTLARDGTMLFLDSLIVQAVPVAYRKEKVTAPSA